MRTTILLSILIVFFSATSAQAQTAGKGFVALHLGIFTSDHPNFSDLYGGSTSFAFGGGLGIPLVMDELKVYGKFIYFSKTDDATSREFRQWLINFGLQYAFPLSSGWSLFVQGGPTYSNSHESWPNTGGTVIDGKGIVGFFGGLGLEKTLPETPLALFGEIQNVFTRSDITTVTGKYGGLNVCIGMRYYF